MSNFWSFYEFDHLMREGRFSDALKAKGKLGANTSGATEAKPTSAVSGLQSLMGAPVQHEKKPAAAPAPAPAAEKPAAAPAAKKSVQIGGEDPLANLPRAAKALAKGQEHKAIKDMSDSEGKAELIARIRQGRTIHDKVMGFNDVTGNWQTGYWIMMDTLKKLGYNPPEIPMEEAPRWVPTRDGGFVRGNYEENGGSPDGPYVTINQNNNPYSVKVADPKHLREILKAAVKVTRAGGDIESESPGKEAWLALRKKKDKGFSSMDLTAGQEGEAEQERMRSVGERRKDKPSGPSRRDLAGLNVRTKDPSKVKLRGKTLDQLEWNQMNEWVKYSDLMLEHTF